MTLVGRHNIAKMYSTTTGTGTLTLTSAVSGFNSFANAGVVNSERVTYTIRDGANTEVGVGTYTSSGTTLSRDTVLSSTNSGSKINCSGSEVVMITLAAEDISPFASYYGSSTSVTDNTDNNIMDLSTESVDQVGLASVASDEITVAKKGFYILYAVLEIESQTATAFNGYISVSFDGYVKTQGYTTAMGISYDMIWVGPILHQILTDGQVLNQVVVNAHLGSDLDVEVFEVTMIRVGNQ